MHMNVRNANAGLGAAVAAMLVGVLVVGANPSDTEMQLIFWPAFLLGIAVLCVLASRERRRDRSRGSSGPG